VDYEIDSSEIESIDELADYFVEQRTAINELELRMWHKIGEILSGKSETEIKQFIKLIKKHLSEIETAIKFYNQYPNFEDFQFDKGTTWMSLKLKFDTQEKRKRESLKEIVNKRYEKNIIEGKSERAEEDRDILNEVLNGNNKNL